MSLDFDGFNGLMEQESGLKILKLAAPGTGPLYQRLVLEYFLREHRTRAILYVADGFAFRSPMWNEERIADPKLLGRTPLRPALFGLLWSHVLHESVDPRALADYATGFYKINNRDRFRQDSWEGEASFDRVFRPSASAEKKRIEYLYPDISDGSRQEARYLEVLGRLLDLARGHGTKVTIVKFPLPPRFRALLEGEAEFDAALQALAGRYGADFADFSESIIDPRFYADTDHLNRAGVTELFRHHLLDLLVPGEEGGAQAGF
ncbi:MAG: SGNH/GDSL hydrolase family protein [Pseudaminobacter sp.]